jgi:hypothetical protein
MDPSSFQEHSDAKNNDALEAKGSPEDIAEDIHNALQQAQDGMETLNNPNSFPQDEVMVMELGKNHGDASPTENPSERVKQFGHTLQKWGQHLAIHTRKHPWISLISLAAAGVCGTWVCVYFGATIFAGHLAWGISTPEEDS